MAKCEKMLILILAIFSYMFYFSIFTCYFSLLHIILYIIFFSFHLAIPLFINSSGISFYTYSFSFPLSKRVPKYESPKDKAKRLATFHYLAGPTAFLSSFPGILVGHHPSTRSSASPDPVDIGLVLREHHRLLISRFLLPSHLPITFFPKPPFVAEPWPRTRI